jgi:hypothetical protein
MANLIPMTDFVLNSDTKQNLEDLHYELIKNRKYALFLKKPLQVWMFIPCDENGNILEKPDGSVHYVFRSKSMYKEDLQKYNEAKERCLFTGFKVIEHELGDLTIKCDDNVINPMWKFKTEEKWRCARGIYYIEDLVKYKLGLTNTALKLFQ